MIESYLERVAYTSIRGKLLIVSYEHDGETKEACLPRLLDPESALDIFATNEFSADSPYGLYEFVYAEPELFWGLVHLYQDQKKDVIEMLTVAGILAKK